MPELPEAEYARRVLDGALGGRRLEEVVLPDPSLLRAGELSALLGGWVLGTGRHGKYLWLDVEGPRAGGLPAASVNGEATVRRLALHLGMSGRFAAARPTPPGELRAASARLVLRPAGGTSTGGASAGVVVLRDPRRLARAAVGTPEEVARALGLDRLGPDAWRLAEMGPDALGRALAGRRGALKPTLLDQTVLAGVGNIQAAEALFLARLDPRRRADGLAPEDHAALAAALDETFRRTLADLEATGGRYLRDGGPHPGTGAPSPFDVYGRAGTPCPRCPRTLLTGIRQSGRSTVFCPGCQR